MVNNDKIKSDKRFFGKVGPGIDQPWEYYYTMGESKLSRGEPYAGLDAYAKAIQLNPRPCITEAALESLEKLRHTSTDLAGYEWVRRLLIIAGALRTAEKAEEARAETVAAVDTGEKNKKASEQEERAAAARVAADRIKKLALCRNKPIQSPVVIVAGGCDSSVEKKMKSYRQVLLKAFSSYRGTVISGGTKEGISSLVGDLGEKYPDTLHTIGYLPGFIPSDICIDYRYKEIHRTEGVNFSPLEPLQYWIDIIASGLDPAKVQLIGINGGMVAASEYKITLALGASAGLVANSGREANKLLRNEKWNGSQKLLCLPADAVKIKTFIDKNNLASKVEDSDQ